MSLLGTIVAAALVNNLVFVHLVGVSPLFAFSRRQSAALETAILSGGLLFASSVVNLLVYRWILQPLQLEFLSLLVFVTLSAGICILLLYIIKTHLALTTRRQNITLSLLSGSSAVIGAALVNTSSLLSIPLVIAWCLGTALGFAFCLVAFAALRQRIRTIEAPEMMRGAALDLISAGIIAMCFLGFSGLV